MNCPKCVGKLQETVVRSTAASEQTELAGASVTYELEADKCFSCGGVWFDKGELDKYLSDQLSVLDSSELGGGLDRELDRKVGNCPRCSVPMQKAPAPALREMTVDVCPKCHGIWLDSTEIDRLERANKPKLGFLELFFKGFRLSQAR
jgi:Zn-finger nucleic acid-binding protein